MLGTEVLFGIKRSKVVDFSNLIITVFAKVRVNGKFAVFSVYNINPDKVV